MGGYIYLDRELFNHWIWEDKPYSRGQAWVDLIQLANFENKKRLCRGEVITVERGYIDTTVSSLSSRWGWSRNKVKSFLNLLSKHEMISYSTAERTIIKIEKYEQYQAAKKRTPEGHPETVEISNGTADNDSEEGQQKDSKRTAKGHIPIKERKERKEINQKRARAHEGETDCFFASVSPAIAEATRDWLDYKAERKDWYTAKGMQVLLNKIQRKATEHGDAAVADIITDSISNRYQGIIWDKLKRQPQNKYSMIGEWIDE